VWQYTCHHPIPEFQAAVNKRSSIRPSSSRRVAVPLWFWCQRRPECSWVSFCFYQRPKIDKARCRWIESWSAFHATYCGFCDAFQVLDVECVLFILNLLVFFVFLFRDRARRSSFGPACGNSGATAKDQAGGKANGKISELTAAAVDVEGRTEGRKRKEPEGRSAPPCASSHFHLRTGDNVLCRSTFHMADACFTLRVTSCSANSVVVSWMRWPSFQEKKPGIRGNCSRLWRRWGSDQMHQSAA